MKRKLGYDIIRYPVNTEKSRVGWHHDDRERWYTFEVDIDATKPQIKKAVEEAFKVKVTNVKTLIKRGKFRRRRFRGGYTAMSKRAVVTLKQGDKIAFFDGI